MRKKHFFTPLALAFFAVLASTTTAAPRGKTTRTISGRHTLTASARYYGDHSAYTNRPFQKDDVGFGLSYEYHDAAGFLQFGLEFCSRPGAETDGFALTPFGSLCFQDRWLFAGLGIRKPYFLDTDQESRGWNDLYFNWLLGIEVPIGNRLSLNLTGFYDFYKWQELDEFKFNDLEVSAGLSLKF